MTAHRKLVLQLVGAVLLAFVASMVFTWMLHTRMTSREAYSLIDSSFRDVEKAIRERIDRRMIRQAMLVRDRLDQMRQQPWWGDPDESSRRIRALADELRVDEICVADSSGLLTHSARREEVGALNFRTVGGQAGAFAPLLDRATEIVQPLMPNTLRGEMVKYVGVWLPEGGFVQVGANAVSLRRLSRTAVTGVTHDWHVNGDDGNIVVTTALGTVISHSDPDHDGSQWTEPAGDECYWKKRVVEGFPVYVVVPKRMAVLERRVLVWTSAFLNGLALVLAAILVGIVIASYVRSQMRAQRDKEMAMASTIQESAIPRVFPPYPDERRADFFADMKTAKDVGGDFYDFYFTGLSKIVFLVADVSDKGVPAALFMMRAKTTIKGIAQTGKPLAEAVAQANAALCQDNGANMFVTAWIGEVDIATGTVTYVNAGHNPPLAVLGHAEDRLSFLRNGSGPALGAVEWAQYVPHEIRLAPGDALLLYTDGVTEQVDEHGEMFGEQRLEAVAKASIMVNPEFVTPRDSTLVRAVLAAVTSFSGGAEQSDDRTMLVMRYNGPGDACAWRGRRCSRTFAAEEASIPATADYMDGVLSENDIPQAIQTKLAVIRDELVSNIVRYSGATGFDIGVEITDGPRGVRLTLSDDGKPYDPLARPLPDVTAPAETRPQGGLGIMVVRSLADSVAYERKHDRNVLTVFISAAGAAADS